MKLTSLQIIRKQAKEIGIKVDCLYHRRLYRLSYKNKQHYIFDQNIDQILSVARQICTDKDVTKELLKKENISIPKGIIINELIL